MTNNKLLYFNEFGGFSEDGKEYIIKTNEKTTPLPWSHVIANKDFGTIVTANGGGYIWYKNSQVNKITTWSNDPLKDMPSEKLILKTQNREIDILPYESLEKFEIIYGFRYAKFIYQDEDIKIGTLIYVPINKNKKVYKVMIESNEELNGTFEYLMEPVLGVSREFTKKHIVIEKEEDKVILKNKYRELYSDDDVLLKFSKPISSFCFDDKKVNVNIELKEAYKFEIQIEVQAENGELQDTEKDMQEIEKFWNDKMKNVKVYTPVESMNIMMNGWLLYQTLACRLWARTSFYQAGGAFGFRDQLQDSMMFLWFDENITRNQILYHAAHQFEEGDVLHFWHPEKNSGTRTRYSDDLLWLPFVLSKYIEYTGDVSILDEKVPYVKCEPLKENEAERYTDVETTKFEDTLYNHAKQAIKYGVKLSDKGLPLMNGGDWNDGMNKIKGNSIWLGFFIYDVLNRFKKVCEIKEDYENIEKYEKILVTLRKSLNENGWDGKWYRRAYFEDETPIGSASNDECKIDGISQSWSVISGAGEIDKCILAMDSLDSYLVDKENMIIKLLTPPFDKTNLNPGYIKEYIPGVRENGGQYTHGAIWSIIANVILRNGDRAGEYFRMINPVEHARTKESVLRYKVEPYVVAADVYASPGMVGRGGWTWYTGSSSWLYIAGLEYVLGISRSKDVLKINPCIPHTWQGFSVRYIYKDTTYNIEVKNPNLKANGICSVCLDNEFIRTNEIKLVNDGREHWVEIVL